MAIGGWDPKIHPAKNQNWVQSSNLQTGKFFVGQWDAIGPAPICHKQW